MGYRITTDSTADLPQAFLKERDIPCVGLSFMLEGQQYTEGPDVTITMPEFYDKLRAGVPATTMQVNAFEFTSFVEPFLAAGEDVLHVAFSSGLSGTYASCASAAEELRAKYPDRQLVVVDTLAASLGEGLLVYYADENRKAGMSLTDNAQWLEQHKLNLCHWFTVDDLMHLHRGGRVSKTSAILGSVIGIKPILHVDDEGHLINVSKARGRKASLDALVKKVGETATDPASQTMFISHSDCEADARYVADQIQAKYGAKEIILNYLGPVIGAHTGPGCVALFFVGGTR